MSKKSNFARRKARIKKANTKQIVSKLIHNTQKVGVNKRRRQNFRKRAQQYISDTINPDKLKFGAINVDGLDLETDMALRDMLETRDFDVSNVEYKIIVHKYSTGIYSSQCTSFLTEPRILAFDN